MLVRQVRELSFYRKLILQKRLWCLRSSKWIPAATRILQREIIGHNKHIQEHKILHQHRIRRRSGWWREFISLPAIPLLSITCLKRGLRGLDCRVWQCPLKAFCFERPAAQQFIDAFHITQADLSQLLTFTKCCLGDNLIEPSFSVLKPLSMQP